MYVWVRRSKQEGSGLVDLFSGYCIRAEYLRRGRKVGHRLAPGRVKNFPSLTIFYKYQNIYWCLKLPT